jgi:hypothetical protein
MRRRFLGLGFTEALLHLLAWDREHGRQNLRELIPFRL